MFTGFLDQEFDAYRAPRASSNAYNRPRLEAKQKAVTVARAMVERAGEGGTALELRASDEHPSVWNRKQVLEQWVFLWRDADARARLEELLDQGRTLGATLADPTPFFRHAFLALHLDADGVDVGLRVHAKAWADARNLTARVSSPAHVEPLVAALRALPEGFTVGVTGEARAPARDVTEAALRSSVEALTDDRWWIVSRAVPRAAAVEGGAGVAEGLLDAFAALLPVYRLVAWSESNDLVSIEASIAEAHAKREASLHEMAAAEAAWQADHEAEIERRREAAEAETRERLAGQERPRVAVIQSTAAKAPPPSQPSPPRRAEPQRSS
ncbi:MAG: hypothetical protein R3A52_20810 [Polyangiales bacterium]